jgi:hypothetical protein
MTKKESKEIVNMEEYLANLAKATTQSERPSGANISCKAGVLAYNGEPVGDNKLDCVVVATTHANLYYEGSYDPNNISSPVCFAYSEDGSDMAPHPESSKPQGTDCASCPQNQWGSSPTGGKGKACKNGRSLAIIPANTSPEDVVTAEMATLKLPVMSVKNWGMYVQKCSALHNRPFFALETQIGTVPDQKSQFRVTFKDTRPLDFDMVKPIVALKEKALALIEHVYEESKPAEAPANKKI